MVLCLRSRANELRHSSPIRDPVLAVFTFFVPEREFYRADGKVSLNLPDLSNLYELPQDALTKAGIWFDDIQVRGHDGSRILPHNSDQYVLRIQLYRYDGPEMRGTMEASKASRSTGRAKSGCSKNKSVSRIP